MELRLDGDDMEQREKSGGNYEEGTKAVARNQTSEERAAMRTQRERDCGSVPDQSQQGFTGRL